MRDPGLTEDQRALLEAVRHVLAKRADPAAVRAADGFDAALWRTLAQEIGVAALPVAEQYDGAGASLVESALVLEEVGRSLAPVPLLGSVVAAHATTDPDLLARIASGEVCAAALGPGEPLLYGAEASIRLDVSGDEVRSLSAGSPLAGMDPTLRFLAPPAGGAHEPSVPGDAAAGRRAGLVGVAALAVGCAQRGLDMTVAYTKERRQFGRPIGSFQALKHRMADMLVLVETARSAARAAAAGTIDPAAAAAYAKDAATHVAAETVQLHGGIAITWEHDAHLVLKRAHALARLGGAAHSLREQALAARVM